MQFVAKPPVLVLSFALAPILPTLVDLAQWSASLASLRAGLFAALGSPSGIGIVTPALPVPSIGMDIGAIRDHIFAEPRSKGSKALDQVVDTLVKQTLVLHKAGEKAAEGGLARNLCRTVDPTNIAQIGIRQ